MLGENSPQDDACSSTVLADIEMINSKESRTTCKSPRDSETKFDLSFKNHSGFESRYYKYL